MKTLREVGIDCQGVDPFLAKIGVDPSMTVDELQRRLANKPPQPAHMVSVWPNHMKGWEAFGCAPEGNVEIRRLGYWERTVGGKEKWKPGTEKWGGGETRNGVGGIEIITSADCPDGAYIYVCGTTEKGVTDVWRRAFDVFMAERRNLWP